MTKYVRGPCGFHKLANGAKIGAESPRASCPLPHPFDIAVRSMRLAVYVNPVLVFGVCSIEDLLHARR